MSRRRAMGRDPLAGLDAERLADLLGEPERPAAADRERADPDHDSPSSAGEPSNGGEPRRPAVEAEPDARAEDTTRATKRLFELQTAFVLDPGNREALLELADLRAARGDHSAAAELLVQVHETHPDDVEVAIRLGRTYGRLTAYGEAEGLLQRALRIDPDNAEARCELGIVLAKRGLYAAAIEELRGALDGDSDLARARYHLGVCFNQLDRLDAAADAFEHAIAADPDDDRAHYHLGIVYDRKGMGEQARAMYRRARQLQTKRG